MTASIDTDTIVDNLVNKTKHYLITTVGRIAEDAHADEIYNALSYALREEVMIRWLAGVRTQNRQDTRMLYYLSMEYLPGRILNNGVTNFRALEIVQAVLQKLNRSYNEIIYHEADPGLGNGGLGRLASCFLDSLATLNYPAQAYGLRYQYGIFEQQLWNGAQVEAPDCWLISGNPWEFRRDTRRVHVKYCGNTTALHNIHGDDIYQLKDFEEVQALPYDYPIVGYAKDNKYSVVTLRLWTTKESPRNFQLQRYNAGRLDQAAENSALTDVLYPSDHHETGKRVRLKQEFLLVSASLQDIVRHYLAHHQNFRSFADKVRIQINDTHPAMVIPELIRMLIQEHDLPWRTAVEMTQACTGYTNHTVLSEALEVWDKDLFNYLLPRQLRIIERLNQEFCNTVRSKYPRDEDKVRRMSIIENQSIRMANLSVIGSHSVNGVSEIHSEILRTRVFKDFYEMFPEKFFNVTNGVTQRRWLLECNPELSKFITKRIGDGWITDFASIGELASFASEQASQEEFLAIKKRNKQQLIEFLNENNRQRNEKGELVMPSPLIEADAIFDVQIKRIHEYKRQLMNILNIIMTYQEILKNPQHQRIKRVCIFAGKAAASYDLAKNIILLINAVARKINHDPAVEGFLKVVFIENYNVSRAAIIIPATDLSEQISTAGTEASGTGNMKLAINGALTIGTDDGANIEMKESITEKWWPFAFGASRAEIEKMQFEHSYNPKEIYNKNTSIQAALNTLRDHTFANNEQEHQAFNGIFQILLEGFYGSGADHYFILKDLESYFETQKKVELLYDNPLLWAEYAIHNIAGMGKFSTDVSIKNYCEKIWGLSPCPTDPEILRRVEHEYRQYGR
ncbi:glycogen/starch/alpha-glucan family phosphorylase [Neochlamydia sp. EPS4]|uniref:glycogen/starch/alpha-glucan family phosphorylase n=1 Tax=Neochlamydia sp. EPS4 TaxID=1478175 RepID=UPI0005D1116B|nr:glycogen/starch/alpha-glucan family phosphorylase [Neochlamydia sp. EPS4]